MTFYMRNYASDERYSLEKFLNFSTDCYDVLDCPFLYKLKQLPVARYYDVNSGYKDMDSISYDVYGVPYYTYYIMYYNDLTSEVVPSGTILNMFDIADLDDLVYNLSNGVI